MASSNQYRTAARRDDKPRASRRIKTLVHILALSLALTGLSGCFLDFDQFESGDAGTTPDATGDGIDPDAGDVDNDAMDTGPDGSTPVDVEVGANCSGDSDCGSGGVCRAGYCTAECSEAATCPAGSTCQSVGDERLCVLSCDPYESCAGAAGRDDLSCVPEYERGSFGEERTVYRGCLPDSDGDQVFDAIDNCPDDANGLQLDRDADGIGDECDSDQLCHAAATDGVIEYGTVSYAAENFVTPAVAAHGWMPVVSGFDGEGNRVTDVAILDRESGGWTTGSLPYAPDELVIGDAPYHSYFATPGVKDEDGDQVGPHMMLHRDGSVTFDSRFDAPIDLDFLTSGREGDIYGFGELAPGALSWRSLRYSPSAHTYSTIPVSFNALSQVRWKATRDIVGNLVVYSDPNATTGDASITIIDSEERTKLDATVTMPMSSTGQFFRPILLPGPGDVFYAWDRNTGEAAYVDPRAGTIERATELDIDFGANVRQIIPAPDTGSLIVLSRPDLETDDLAATEYFVRCPGLLAERDSDSDGEVDVRDNCPKGMNGSQLDTDFDGRGDSCDQDVDGDGIPNSLDQVSSDDGTRFVGLDLDSDNDRMDNPADQDDDSDGIPDTRDRFPLDSDNDGIPNARDDDDDADGFSDSTERSSDTNQFIQFDFPNAGTLAYFEGDGSTRTIKVGELADLENAVVREISSDAATPSRLSFSADGQELVVLDGEPEQTQQIRVGPVDEGTGRAPTSWQVGTTLRDVLLLPGDVSAGTVSNATVVTETASGWNLVRVSFNPQSQTVLVSDLTQVREIAFEGSRMGVVGAPADCPDCLGVYYFDPESGTQGSFLSNDIVNPRSPSVRGSTVYVIGDNRDGTSSAFAVSQNSTSVIRPPMTEQVDSLVTGLGGVRNHLLVSASADGSDTFDLYFFNRTRGKWYKVMTTSTDIVDLTWTSRSPNLEQPEQPEQ